MNLKKKKLLAARALNVGKERIVFLKPWLEEIKEAITKQDIKDLQKEGAIIIKEIKGRLAKKRKKNRTQGRIKKKVNTRKKDYISSTRKLKNYLKGVRERKKLSADNIKDIKNKIKNRAFRSLAHFKEYLNELKK